MNITPVFMPIRKLSRMVRDRRISPVDLSTIFLDRLERIGPKYNAVVTVTRELAMEQARRAEHEIASGRYRGPLHGIPYGVKDLLATGHGIPTTWGAVPFREQVFDRDATVIRKLEEAGALLAAKLSMVELAGGMGYQQPDASITGPGITPWDEHMWSGGSSSGSGAAVCAGLVPFAVGSETWGSILSPASNCGVAGLRPTYGRVSRYGAMALSWSLDKIGPLCLTADDCGIVLEAMAGYDPCDPTSSRRPCRYTHDAEKRRFRFGIIEGVADDADGDVRANFKKAVKDLDRIGTIETVGIPDLPYEEITRIILFAEGASAFEEIIDSGQIGELTAPEDRYSAYARTAILAKDYIRALRLRRIVTKEIENIMSAFDALIAPARATPATPIDKPFRSATRGSAKDVMGAIGNSAGLPAISVPSGFSEKGLPTGIQFMGRTWQENTVIAAAAAYQSLTDWHRKHPPNLD